MTTTCTTIESLSHDGRGIARIDGKTTFLENALPGETVEFTYKKRRSKYDEGKVVNVITASPNRVKPQCTHFGICGGCSLQHFDHNTQIVFKQKVLLEQLQYIGGVKPQTVLPPLIAPIWGYRRKARLGVKFVIKKNKLFIGFREKNQRYLTDIQDCSILHPVVGKKIFLLNELIANLNAYQDIPQIEVAIGDNANALIIRHLRTLDTRDLENLKNFAKREQFYIYLQLGGPETVTLLWPENSADDLYYSLAKEELKLFFQPTDFTQVNADINQQMVTQALTLLAPGKNDRILDLFCGLGNFTLPLAKYCDEITGVEGDAAMVERCQQNADYNELHHAKFYAANLAADFSKAAWAQHTYDKIILDPPRCGAEEAVNYFKNFAAKQVLYISCNPATLARDAAILIQRGYTLSKVGMIDMFPHTSHIEAMASFESPQPR